MLAGLSGTKSRDSYQIQTHFHSSGHPEVELPGWLRQKVRMFKGSEMKLLVTALTRAKQRVIRMEFMMLKGWGKVCSVEARFFSAESTSILATEHRLFMFSIQFVRDLQDSQYVAPLHVSKFAKYSRSNSSFNFSNVKFHF